MDMCRILDGYEVVGNKVREYWKNNPISDVVILLRLDGYPEEVIAYCESDYNDKEVTFNTDFWEGEQLIEVELITPLYEVLSFWRDNARKEAKR